MQKYSGTIIDLFNKKLFKGHFTVSNQMITNIIEDETAEGPFYLPGFTDAHIHIESSMLTPAAFAAIAVKHGTIATVSDPHEIANVLGIDGVKFMIENAKTTPFKCCFGAPSCVPATSFETAGAIIDAKQVAELLQSEDIFYLSEMMNYPGVINAENQVIEKLEAAKKCQKPIDGHAPGLIGKNADIYFSAGITTDHECFTLEEALYKANLGVKILIREGSAAKNFDALHPLISSHPKQIMFCSDDKHPDELLNGHINIVVKKALALGYDFWDVLYAACIAPVLHYNLPVGLLRVGDNADFISVNNLSDLDIFTTTINGVTVFENNKSKINIKTTETPNNFVIKEFDAKNLEIFATNGVNPIRVIQALDEQLITESFEIKPKLKNQFLVEDIENDILKIVVLNRYKNEKPAIAFIKGFGLKNGAIASTVAHDSHNLIAVGSCDLTISRAINKVIEAKGGISFANLDTESLLHLPIAGLMSNKPIEYVAEKYKEIDLLAKSAGSKLTAPFMTLSFMALLVIPQLKLSDLGLFDGLNFNFVPLQTP